MEMPNGTERGRENEFDPVSQKRQRSLLPQEHALSTCCIVGKTWSAFRFTSYELLGQRREGSSQQNCRSYGGKAGNFLCNTAAFADTGWRGSSLPTGNTNNLSISQSWRNFTTGGLSTVCLYIKHKLKTNKQQPTILKLLNLHGSLISFTLSLVHASYPKHGNFFKLQLKQGN